MIIQLGTSKGYPVLWDGKNIVVKFEYPKNTIDGFRVGIRYKYRPAIKYCYAHLNDFKELQPLPENNL